MNLHAIVSGAIQAVNPDFVGSIIYASGGYTTSADGTRTPITNQVDGVQMQVQALTAKEIEHLDGLNIQGTMRAVYFNGTVQGLNRAAGKGGDILLIPTHLTTADFDTWLVVQVLEQWDADGWGKVAVQLQNPPVSQ